MKIVSTRRLKDLFFPIFSIYKISISEKETKLYILKKVNGKKQFKLLMITDGIKSSYGFLPEQYRAILSKVLGKEIEIPSDIQKFYEINKNIMMHTEGVLEREYHETDEKFAHVPLTTRLLQGELFTFRKHAYFYISKEANTFGFWEGGLLRRPKYKRAITRHLSDNQLEVAIEVLYTVNQYLIRQPVPSQTFTQRWYDEYKLLAIEKEPDVSSINREKIYPMYVDYVFSRILEEMPRLKSGIGRKNIVASDALLPVHLLDLLRRLQDIDMYRVVKVILDSDRFAIQDGVVQYISPVLMKELGLQYLYADIKKST